MPDQDNQHESDEQPAEPLNRAERRAQRRGKNPSQAQAPVWGRPAGHRDQVRAPRRSGRRGNR
jgi:hypothetical protein